MNLHIHMIVAGSGVWNHHSPFLIPFPFFEQGKIEVPDQLSNRSEVEIGRKLARTYLEISFYLLYVLRLFIYYRRKKMLGPAL